MNSSATGEDDLSRTRPSLARIDGRAIPSTLRRLLGLAWRYPWRCILALGCTLGAALLNLAVPWLLGRAVDAAHHLLQGGGEGVARTLAHRASLASGALLILASAARGGLTGLQGYLGENVAQRVGYDLRLAFFEQLQRLDHSYHDAAHSGDLIARGMLDLEGVRAFIESGLLRVVTLVLLLGVGAWRLFGSDATLAALAFAFVPVVVWRATRMGLFLRQSWLRLQQLMSALTLCMEENLQGMHVVRAFASMPREMHRFDAIANEALRMSNHRITVRMSATSTMHLAYYVSMGLVLAVGGHRVEQGLMTVGRLTEFLAFITILQQPVRQLGMVVNSGARAASSGARLFAVLDARPALREAQNAHVPERYQGVLRFESVGFAYGDTASSRPVLSDISFEVGPGRTLGIVGPPGSGKSTIANLIPRFYDVTAGRITLDGIDIRDIGLASLRATVSSVQQDVFLFDTTVHENIAYSEPDAKPARVVAAASIAQIHEHVARLPLGYATRVGERGAALSGGQRQRASIARGLLGTPAVIVLDDSTAALDARTERQVRHALRETVRHCATLIISHRLGSVQHSDEIIVLDAGRIVERGTHAELLRAAGTYAELWALQRDQHHNEVIASRPSAEELGATLEEQP
ncbi:ABC transporter ATP-binding protein [Caballeronia sp. DA-9]|uniref:ABC transporter ATP-binding protein n=1 Tax=Caballeronia sp. DA-9 TaxID=3436237 RepID=UPI003F671147